MRFKVGDRVVAVENYDPIKEGMTGVVKSIVSAYPPIGVVWNNFNEGHGLNNISKYGKSGYFVRIKNIRLFNEPNDMEDPNG